MSDIMERLWPAFISETTEKLQELELLLVGVPADEVDVHGVFRAMHTIKGGCAMMGFTPMESLAHAAEDVLEPIRRGAEVIGDDLIDLLLEVVDALKAQLSEVDSSRSEPASRDELVVRLRDCIGTARAVPATTGEPPAASEFEVELARQFCETVSAILPEVAGALIAGKRLQKDKLAALAATADAAGYRAVSVLAGRLPGDSPLADLAALVERVAAVEQRAAADAGVQVCYQQCRPLLADQVLSGAADMVVRLQAIEGDAGVSAIDKVLKCLKTMQARLLLTGCSTSLLLYRLLAQLLRDMQRGLVAPSAVLLKKLREAVAAPLELDQSLFESDAYQHGCDRLIAELGALVDSARGQGAASAVREQIRSQLSITPAALDAMSPEVLETLWSLTQHHAAIYEVAVDLEASRSDSAQLVRWFDDDYQLLSSYTLPASSAPDGSGMRARVAFVVSAGQQGDAFEAGLGEFRAKGLSCSWINCSLPHSAASSPDARRAPTRAAVAEGNATGSLRVDSQILDRFLGRVGEMVTLRNAMSHTLHDDDLMRRMRLLMGKFTEGAGTLTLQADEVSAVRKLLQDMDSRIDGLAQADIRFHGALARLQEDVLALRVVPIATVFNRLPRMVRDLASSSGKQVEIELEGDEVRIDKSMVEALMEPLMHLVRNCIDHGIEAPARRLAAGKPERGAVAVRADQQAGLLRIEIEDDGNGIDTDRIRSKAISKGMLDERQAQTMSKDELVSLIFEPGFSTASQVTEVSGRGVGMDAVRNRIQHLGGTIQVESDPGRGTRFVLRMPLSLAIQNVVLVKAGQLMLALPERYVNEVIAMSPSMLQSVQGQAAFLLRGVAVPLFGLSALLGQPSLSQHDADREIEVLVISDGSHRIGLIVDTVMERAEVFIRDVHPQIARMPAVSGVSVLGNGRVAVILDCDALISLAATNAQTLTSLLKAS